MNKTKVFIDWTYQLNPKEQHYWTNSNIEDADIVISINKINDLNCSGKKVLWLYEPKDIKIGIYDTVRNKNISYDFVASHCETLPSKIHSIHIDPCFPSWIDDHDRAIHVKTKNISMIASTKILCDGHKYRQEIASKMSENVDLYGHGRKNTIDSKIEGLKEYRFSIAMENSCVDIYYTEKILDCFLTGCIPIYWGTKKIINIFNQNGIIMLEDFLKNIDNFNFEKEYESRKDAIIENFEKAKTMNLYAQDGINQIIEKVKQQ